MITITQQAEAAIWASWAKVASIEDPTPIKELYNIEIYSITDGIEYRLVARRVQPTTTEPKEAVQLLQPKDKPVKRAENAGRAKRKVWVKEPNGKGL